ncbi:efflux RND transporter periplasmic adaptor subunit [Rhizobium sullae]|uniref:Efflux RND transporter periplasmic adaptor subunit n=1 Tax=Rhizobium sullae TaxID=50338 RepID=A0A2N0D5T9_RHISU|nr:efflux RND transporter periplasmic adaptor subunit [Rhizobium sullae]PKA41465.1 MexE family multidrug efflux RND transporter periplasmic adaptor subunit [Rhizobium sullae]UWU13104.1 efflux RND transporter periplasmic adaptor subunit [Rhizobium sullae]
MTSRKKRWALVGAGIGLVASVSAAAVFFELPMSTAATAASAPAQAPAVPVTVSVVAARNVTAWEEFSGRLEAVDRVQVRSRVAGAIQSAHFREGALVKAGDLLFTIDPAPYQAAVSQAEGQAASAEAKVSLAQIELERGRRLSDSRTISQSDMDQRQSAYTEAQAGLRTAQAALRSAQLDLSYTEVRAPVSGRVGKLEITAGNLVAAGSASPALTTLVSVDPIYASFNASEEMVTKALSQLPAGDGAVRPLEQIPVEVGTLADEGTPIKGKLQLVDNQVDAASGTIGVRAVFDNPGGKLLPGQFVRVRMGQPKAENRVLVSERAIGTDQDKKFVFVVDGENKVSYRPVQLGNVSDGLRVVESGLNPGDTIVVNGLQRIRPGAIVEPQMEEKVAAK